MGGPINPALVEAQRRLQVQRRRERREAVAEAEVMLQAGESVQRAVEASGRTLAAIEIACRREGRPDLAARFQAEVSRRRARSKECDLDHSA